MQNSHYKMGKQKLSKQRTSRADRSIQSLSKAQPSKPIKESPLGENYPMVRTISEKEYRERQKAFQQEVNKIMRTKNNEQKKEEIKRAVKRVKMGEKAWATTDKPQNNQKNLPTIKILAKREVKMIELDIDMSSRAKEILFSIGRENILKDERAIISCGFLHAIKSGIEYAKKLK